MPPSATVTLTCKRLHHDAKLPSRVGVHGLDVYAYLKSESGHPTKFVLPAGITRMVPTGVSVTPTPPYAVMLLSHVNLATRGVNVLNTLPITRDLTVLLHNSGAATEWIEHNDSIAQLVLVQLPTPIVEEAL